MASLSYSQLDGKAGMSPVIVAWLLALMSFLLLASLVQLVVYNAFEHSEFGHIFLYFLVPGSLAYAVLMCYSQLVRDDLQGWRACGAAMAATVGSFLVLFGFYYVATESLGVHFSPKLRGFGANRRVPGRLSGLGIPSRTT